jgi:ATP-dependent RNA helicase DDX27
MVKQTKNFKNKKFDNKFKGNKKRVEGAHNENPLEIKDELILNNKKKNFDFDGDTNIVSKLRDNSNSIKRKNVQNTSWNYSKILSEENEMVKLKEAKKRATINSEKEDIQMTDAGERDNKNNEDTQGDDNNLDFEEDLNEEELNNINKFESDVYSKNSSFCDFNLSKIILKALADLEFFHPTKIQEKVIPVILRGNDVLVNSETGSGKTACFLLPIIQKIITNKNSKTPIKALILLPTRELALQCTEMLQSFLKYLEEVTFACICGGMAIENQINKLKTDPDIIIATPGRLIDMLYNYKSTSNFESISILVLDEADKLLELGFKDAIIELISLIKNNDNRQTLLFSATLNTKITELGKDTLRNPIKIKMASSAILSNLKQSIVRMQFKKDPKKGDRVLTGNEFEQRMAYLLNLLKMNNKNMRARSIIFFNTKKECHKAFLTLKKFSIPSAELHSDIHQTERVKALDSFQKGLIPYLICTDIAARGIDIEKVRCVINFQMPVMEDRYIHRIGRTARKGYIGEAITICDDDDRLILKKLIKREKFVLSNIKVENSSVKAIYKQLVSWKEAISDQINEYLAEKELQEAERDVEKTINLKMHSNEIYNKPRKEWFMNKKEKKDLEKKLRKEYLNRIGNKNDNNLQEEN